MIISRTPLRMSFVGGGSDLPSFYREYGGAVVSTAIDKYIYVTINQKFDESLRVSYSKTEEVASVEDLQHPIVREAMKLVGFRGGLEITSIADIPAKGTGLGSSSAFTVALLHALYAHKGQFVGAETLAKQSCEIEIDRIGEPIGKQDQYAAAFGGFSYIEFLPDDSVRVDPVICRPSTLRQIEERTLVFYTGITRSASAILRNQDAEVRSSRSKQQMLREMAKLALELKRELEGNNVDSFGNILHENWKLKKSLVAGVSTPGIDDWYARARTAGALGGKLLGAGSGGFMMFHAAPEKHASIRAALSDIQPVRMGFERRGSSIIFTH